MLLARHTSTLPQKLILYLVVQIQILVCSYFVFQIFSICFSVTLGCTTQIKAKFAFYTVVRRELKFRFLIALLRPYYLLIRSFWEQHQTYNNKHSFHGEVCSCRSSPAASATGPGTNPQERCLSVPHGLEEPRVPSGRAFAWAARPRGSGAGAAVGGTPTRIPSKLRCFPKCWQLWGQLQVQEK